MYGFWNDIRNAVLTGLGCLSFALTGNSALAAISPDYSRDDSPLISEAMALTSDTSNVDVTVYSASWKTIDAQNTLIKSVLAGINSSIVFQGYCKVGDTTPAATANYAWLSLDSGLVYGYQVEKSQLLVGNGSTFDIWEVDALKQATIVDPTVFQNSNSYPSSSYSSSDFGVDTSSSGVANYSYSVIPGSTTDTLTVVDASGGAFSIQANSDVSMLSAIYENSSSSTDTVNSSMLVLNQRAGNNLKVLNQTSVASGTDFGMTGTYFVSSSEGSDSNDGLSAARPKKTLAAVTALNPVAGSKVALKAGDTFRETFNPKSNGTAASYIVYGAYGSGAKPVISGCDIVSGWSKYSGNIYRAALSSEPSSVFVDGQICSNTRYPKEGYATISTITGNNVIYSSSLPSNIDYKGARFLARATQFNLRNETVSASSANTITVTSVNNKTLTAGFGFILLNKLEFLTQENEWYYDSTNKYLYLWLPNGVSPTGHTVEASVRDYCADLWSNYIQLENINFSGARVYNIYSRYSDYPKIIKCASYHGGYMSIRIDGQSPGVLIDSCKVIGSAGAGIASWSNNAVITNNDVRDIGVNKYWNSQTTDYCGFAIIGNGRTGSGVTITNNRVMNVGYAAINFNSVNSIVRYNFINGAMSEFGDGGGIYTWQGTDLTYTCAGSVVSNNIILNCKGNLLGTTSYVHYNTSGTYGNGYGIYLDLNSLGITIENNYINGCEGGITFGGIYNCIFRNNLIVNNSVGFVAWLNAGSQSGSTFTNNTVVAFNRLGSYNWWANEAQVMLVNQKSDIVSDKNIFFQNYATTNIFRYSTYNSGYKISFSLYKLASGQDANSTCYNGTYSGAEECYYNATMYTKNYSLVGSYTDLLGNKVSTFSLQPFTAKVVVKVD